MSILMIWTKVELALRLSLVVPTIDLVDAYAHAAAAIEAADSAVPAELLLAIAYVESRYDPTATSRIEGSVRRTGRYPSTTPPPNLRGTLYCGPLQTYAKSWEACLAMRDLASGYSSAVEELGRWMRDPRVKGNVTRALLGHGCGNHGLEVSRCNGYPAKILNLMRRLARPAAPARAVI